MKTEGDKKSYSKRQCACVSRVCDTLYSYEVRYINILQTTVTDTER